MKALALAALSACLLVACADDVAPLSASDVRVTRPLPGTQMSAGYFTLANNTAEPVVVDRVSSPQFGNVEMHETRIEDGVARMAGLAKLEIPAGSSVTFAPGGKHLMLMRPDADLADVTLEFHADGAMVLAVTVEVGD